MKKSIAILSFFYVGQLLAIEGGTDQAFDLLSSEIDVLFDHELSNRNIEPSDILELNKLLINRAMTKNINNALVRTIKVIINLKVTIKSLAENAFQPNSDDVRKHGKKEDDPVELRKMHYRKFLKSAFDSWLDAVFYEQLKSNGGDNSLLSEGDMINKFICENIDLLVEIAVNNNIDKGLLIKNIDVVVDGMSEDGQSDFDRLFNSKVELFAHYIDYFLRIDNLSKRLKKSSRRGQMAICNIL